MRALKLHPTDKEVFNGIVDSEKHSFFYSHLSAFKRMWTEEGKVYWVRFLLTFKLYFEADLVTRPAGVFFLFDEEGKRILEFLYVYIHKEFIENSCNTATKFLENVFTVSKHIHSLPEPKGMRNPFYSKNSREAFRSLLGEPDLYEELPIAVITFACSVYALFTGSICNLLKCWLRETDLSEDSVKRIDYALLYWKPDPEWTDEFSPLCFEKHLADCWKSDLPKMLLTCDIHNIFSAHSSKNCCCDYTNEMNLFDLLQVQNQPDKHFYMKHVAIIIPDVLHCKDHSNCRVLIVHEPYCIHPYLCDASGSTCVITCEISRKILLKDNGNINRSISPKMSFTEISVCKKKNTRTVSTLIESGNREIVTYLNLKNQDSRDACMACEYLPLKESMCLYDDHEMRNSFNQHKKKYELKMRLRTKLDKKLSSQCEQFSDQYCVHLYERARQSWLNELCHENTQNMGNINCQKLNEKSLIEGSLKYIKGLITSVAVGTSDVIFGRVVCSTGSHAATSTLELRVQRELVIQNNVNNADTQSKSKKLKARKKKKDKANYDTDRNPPGNRDNGAITDVKLSGNEFKYNETIQSKEKIKSDGSIKEDKIQVSRMKNSSEPITKVLKEKDARELEVKEESNISKVVTKECKNTNDSIEHEEHTSAVVISELSREPIFENNLKGNLNAHVFLHDVCAEYPTKQTNNYEKMSSPMKVSPPKQSLSPKDEETVDKFFELIGVIKKAAQEEKSELNPSLPTATDQGTAQICDKTDKKSKLRICAFCSKKEVENKTFKRCGRCKVENFPKQHYYCSRACQIDDWEKSHRNEHSKKSKNPVGN